MFRNLFFCVFIFFLRSLCSATAGGSITYQYIGNNKYDVSYTLYRDCRDVAVSSSSYSFFIYDPSTNKTLNLYPKYYSIRDISTTCKTAEKCNPANTQISSANPIYEEHIYKYTIDFNGNEKNFKSSCLLKLFAYRCCRNSNISTGSAGSVFYIVSELDLCAAKNNSSPVFLTTPILVVNINQPTFLLITAIDSVDKDSLSYHFVDPLASFNSVITWNSGFSAKSPITDYWPAGYDKSKGPNPNGSPPIGTYLDKLTGALIFTPIDSNQVSPICIAVREWRKDSSGSYKQIGEVRKELTLVVKSLANNNPPILNGPYNYSLCSGNQICFTITSDDKQFIPPPPQKPLAPDTVTLNWNRGNLNNASFNIVNSKARLKSLKFCWTPSDKEASNIPYSFNVTATDNHCPFNAVTQKSYSITVKPAARTKLLIKHLANNLKVIESQIIKPFGGTPYYYWQILDSLQMPLSNENYFFKSSKLTYSNYAKDTLIFRKSGKYLIKHIINNSPSNCQTVYFDTINIPKVIDVSFFKTKDTSVCKGVLFNFNAMVINGVPPYVYKWGTNSGDTSRQLKFITYKDSLVELEVTDALGQKAFSWCSIKVLKNAVNAGMDEQICPNDSIQLIAEASNFLTLYEFQWFFKGNKIGNHFKLQASEPGYYTVQASDTNGCYVKDSVLVKNFNKPNIKLYDSSYCQIKNVLTHNELIKSPSNLDNYPIVQWQIIKTLKNPKGVNLDLQDLLSDLNINSGYDFLLAIDKSKIDLNTKFRDTLIYSIQVTDSNHCKASDTSMMVIKKMPLIIFKFPKKNVCFGEYLEVDSLAYHDGDSRIWTKVNEIGYNDYPVAGNLKSKTLGPQDFYKIGGNYKLNLVVSYAACQTEGSMVINLIPLPISKIDKVEDKDSVFFTDKSLNTTKRAWYLDTVFISANKVISLDQNAANGKSIRLKLENGNCNLDTQFLYKTLSMGFYKNNLIKIYPNPTNHNLTITQLKTFKNGTYEIYNTMGQLILREELTSNETVVNMESFATGLYFLKVKNQKMTVSFQFVKAEL